jgi:hypothetical protein
MHIAQFLDPLALGPEVEVIKAGLPDMPRCVLEQRPLLRVSASPLLGQQTARKTELQSLHNLGRRAILGFAEQQMNVFRHDHVADHHELVASPHPLENLEKQVAALGAAQERLSLITTERDVVEVAGSVEAFESPRHGDRLGCGGSMVL